MPCKVSHTESGPLSYWKSHCCSSFRYLKWMPSAESGVRLVIFFLTQSNGFLCLYFKIFFKKTTAPSRVQFDLSSCPNNMFDVSRCWCLLLHQIEIACLFVGHPCGTLCPVGRWHMALFCASAIFSKAIL